MRKCVQFKEVSRKDGKTQRVCARYVDAESGDILVPNTNEKALGVLIPEPLAGLGDIGVEDVIGPAVGGVGAILGTLLARRYGYRISPRIAEFAPIAGSLV